MRFVPHRILRADPLRAKRSIKLRYFAAISKSRFMHPQFSG